MTCQNLSEVTFLTLHRRIVLPTILSDHVILIGTYLSEFGQCPILGGRRTYFGQGGVEMLPANHPNGYLVPIVGGACLRGIACCIVATLNKPEPACLSRVSQGGSPAARFDES
jgi:hypothetical protein